MNLGRLSHKCCRSYWLVTEFMFGFTVRFSVGSPVFRRTHARVGGAGCRLPGFFLARSYLLAPRMPAQTSILNQSLSLKFVRRLFLFPAPAGQLQTGFSYIYNPYFRARFSVSQDRILLSRRYWTISCQLHFLNIIGSRKASRVSV